MDHGLHERLSAAEFTESNLMDAVIYGQDDQKIGNVSHLHGSGGDACVVVDVGGFLGIGSEDVAIDYSQGKWEQGNGSWWIIVPTTADQLKALPDFDPKPYQPAAAASDTSGSSTGGMAPSTGMGTSGMKAPATGSDTTTPDTTAPKKQ